MSPVTPPTSTNHSRALKDRMGLSSRDGGSSTPSSSPDRGGYSPERGGSTGPRPMVKYPTNRSAKVNPLKKGK